MPQPTKIPRPFADSGDKNSIPDSSGSIGFASWQEGFPAITSEPFASGGVAPKRADFNGIFNALSAAIVWAQEGGVYAYDNVTDYEVGNIAVVSGVLYICKTANGPSSAVKDPAGDTAETYWGKVYPQNGTYSRMYFSQTSGSYTAPYTGRYRISLKGGGGSGATVNSSSLTGGSGGGEGGLVVFYATLTEGTAYSYTIGAGGAAVSATGTTAAGVGGGASSFDLGNGITPVANGGGGALNTTGVAPGAGGTGVLSQGVDGVAYRGAAGQVLCASGASSYAAGSSGGGVGASRGAISTDAPNAVMGGGGGGGSRWGSSVYGSGAGGDGFILIEYAG